MNVTINGDARSLKDEKLTVHDLLSELGLGCRRVAVEQNLMIVPRARHATTPVRDGDVIEIVSFVGGG